MNRKIVFLIVTLLVVLGGSISYYFWNKSTDEKEYHKQLIKLLDDIDYSTTESAVIGGSYQEYWGEIIDRSIPLSTISEDLEISEEEIEPLLNWSNQAYFGGGLGIGLEEGNFDTMITIVRMAKSDATEVALNNHDIVTKNLSLLKNPPAKYEQQYKAVLDLYENYNTFISLSTSPIGSYIEYSKNLNSTYETVQSKLQTAKIQIQ
ncbi:hypothetical protein JOC25_001001 [Solibacillus kalamii]|uniref:Uncharacterized protein n=1 Tax=Solibacillus kalamii TaxID=1748298 RepID=A0ABX3ZJS8_9BACL|nr:hypothetical protein [Solibacillus kalamii]MBM7664545.1 hypothetical protein [Solibacillus kalamii]OUZ39706.1 hypothetical protein CBM15_04140 [Solibacillus kalamii]